MGLIAISVNAMTINIQLFVPGPGTKSCLDLEGICEALYVSSFKVHYNSTVIALATMFLRLSYIYFEMFLF